MRIYYGSENLTIGKTAVALGDFDAIHEGHKAIINSAGEYAKEHGISWAVYMFSQRPNKAGKSINSLEKRLEILEEMGVDAAVIEEFDEEYKNTECSEFVQEYILKRLNAEAVFVGYNYRFGKGAMGDSLLLEKLCGEFGTDVFVSECVEIDGAGVSSTEIRRLIENGDMKKVTDLMGRYFSLSGKVVKGKQLGRTIGFPTANIEYPLGIVIPENGVYISRTKVGNDKYYSITNVGGKPTVDDENKNIETAIGEFSKDIYGETIEIEFADRIRNIEKFDDLAELKKQLDKDMKYAKEYFEKEK